MQILSPAQLTKPRPQVTAAMSENTFTAISVGVSMSSNSSTTMGTPTMVQRLQGNALLSCGLAMIAGAAMLSSSGSLGTNALWVSACLALGAWGQQRGRQQERQRSRHEHYEQALAALQSTGQGVPGSALLQSAFDHSASPMVITDAMDRIVMVNTAFTPCRGCRCQRFAGQKRRTAGDGSAAGQPPPWH